MRITRFRATVAAVAAAALGALAACGTHDQVTAPAQVAVPVSAETQALLDGGLLGSTLTSTLDALTLVSCPTPAYGSVTKTIGPAGGTIAVGPHTFVVPPYALAKSTAITMTAPKGNSVRVEMQPEGLRFEAPTALTLSFKHCLLPPLLPRVVYVGDKLNILELVPSVFSSVTRTVTGKIDHFSGYAVAD